jgi:uncharacterized protein YqeY
MSLFDDIKAAQLRARKDRNTVKATLLTTLITEASTGLAATLRTEAENAINKLANGDKTKHEWPPGRLDVALAALKQEAKAEGWDEDAYKAKVADLNALAESEGWPLGRRDAEIAKVNAQFNKDWLPSDEQVEKVIGKFVKAGRDNLAVFEQRGNAEKVDEVKQELEILTDFLPKQLTEGELTEVINNFRAEHPSAQIGQIMGHLKASFQGRYDPKMASRLANG